VPVIFVVKHAHERSGNLKQQWVQMVLMAINEVKWFYFINP
jgi:hypothetical protein